MLRGRIANRRKHITPFRELTIPHGSLQLVSSVPLVHVRGSHREMGRALGTLVGVQAAETFHSYMQCFAPDFCGDLELARGMEPSLPEWFKEEMLGFSETSELTYEQMLVGQCFLDIHKVAACSTIAVHDKLTDTGEMLIGRNLDFPSLDIAHEANMVVVYEPEGSGSFSGGSFGGSGSFSGGSWPEKVPDPFGQHRTPNTEHQMQEAFPQAPCPMPHAPPKAYASVTWPGFLGCLTGLNDRGLALSMMLVYGHSRHEHLRCQPFPLVFRRLLHECDTVQEADQLLQTKPYCTATNLILADANRTAARFQLHPNHPVVEYTTPELPATACTNHYHAKALKAFAFTWFSSRVRYQRLQRRIKSGRKWDIEAIKHALQATGIPMINLQRAIMQPEQRSLQVSFERNGRGPGRWVEFDREQLFPSYNASLVRDPEAVAVLQR
jgi:predicted choloylglycine hydrolase